MRAAAARFLLALFVCAMLFAGPAAAQTQTTPASAVEDASGLEYAEWETLADRAEEALEAGRASDEAFEALREELVQWRGRLLAAQSINQSRIVTLRAQLDALGPVPEEGITEPEEIAERRLELDTQLARMEAPVLRADEAFLRADGLIREIDILIRTRQTEALTRTGPSPLNPANWATALQEVSGTVASVGQEVVDALSNQTQRQAGENNLPLAVFYLLVAALLLVRGKAWVARLCAQAAQFQSVNLRNLSAVVFSLGHVVLPYVAVLAVVQAVDTVDILGLRGTRILALIPQAALTVLAARWLAGQMVPVQTSAQALIDVPAAERFRARLSIASLGVIVALGQLIVGIAYVDDFSEATIAVTSYPLVVVAALFLFRVGRRLNSIATAEADPAVRNFRHTMLRTVGRATLVLAFAAPLLATAGMTQAALFICFPTILTLGVFGLLLVLQRVVVDAYAVIIGDEKAAEEALIPVLIAFALVVLALPPLALIWGARVTDLTEVWARFTNGIAIGDVRFQPTDFLTFVVVFVLGFTLTRLLQGALRSAILPRTKIDPGAQSAVVAGLGYVGVFLAGLAAISSVGIDLRSFAIVAGALSVGIGFGLQTIVSNFVSGIILLIERPVTEGDWIEVGGVMGTVRDISVRSTRVETFDRTDVIVPNSDLISGQVTNWTRNNLTGRLILPVGVAYGTDTKRVETVLREIAESHPLVIVSPAPQILFMGFGADSLDFEMRVILRNVNLILLTRSELNHEIARRFAEEGFEIPFAQRDIWLRNPETLQPDTAQPPADAAENS